MSSTIPMNPWPMTPVNPWPVPLQAPYDFTIPACRGLHLVGSNWLNHWREGEIVKTRCPYCNATWEVRVP